MAMRTITQTHDNFLYYKFIELWTANAYLVMINRQNLERDFLDEY